VTQLGDVLESVRQSITIDPLGTYTNLGVRSFGRGVFHYPDCIGADLSKLKFFIFQVPSLVVSNIKAWEGAIALTSDKDEGCVASNRFLFYVGKEGRADIRYIYQFLLSAAGRRSLEASSPGSADRNRTLSIKAFERIDLDLPSYEEQVAHADHLQKRLDLIRHARNVAREQQELLDDAWYACVDEAFS
jgi:type I restriction enzyme S subunit